MAGSPESWGSLGDESVFPILKASVPGYCIAEARVPEIQRHFNSCFSVVAPEIVDQIA